MIELNLTQDFPAGLDRLWVAFGRADYPRQKYLTLGATAVRTGRFSATAQAIDVEIERDVPVDPRLLPSWARMLIGRQQTVRHRSAWRRAGPARATAELDISPVGLPVRAHGLGTIAETSPGTTRMVLTWRVESNLPVIGHKIERLFAEMIRTSLDADHAFTLNYLEADGPSRRRDLSGFPDALWERKPPRLGRLRNFRSRRLDVCHPVRRRVCGCRP